MSITVTDRAIQEFTERKSGDDNMNEITVVGDPSAIEHKIFKNSKRQILRG